MDRSHFWFDETQMQGGYLGISSADKDEKASPRLKQAFRTFQTIEQSKRNPKTKLFDQIISRLKTLAKRSARLPDTSDTLEFGSYKGVILHPGKAHDKPS